MNNQNNPYPDVSNNPLIGQQNNQPINNPFPINQNQGYPPQNQNFGPPPPNQGYMPPPPPPHPYNNNQGFAPNNGGYIPGGQGFGPSGLHLMCLVCRRETDNFPKKVPGGVTLIWCFCLFIFTGLCCCIPFCIDSCLDTELVCVVCQCVKGRMEAKCC